MSPTSPLSEARRSIVAAEQRIEAEAIELAIAIAKKLVPELVVREPFGEIAALVTECFRQLVGVPHIVVRVPQELVDRTKSLLDRQARERGFEGRLVVEHVKGLAGIGIDVAFRLGQQGAEPDRDDDRRVVYLARNVEEPLAEIARDVVQTSGAPVRLLLTPERNSARVLNQSQPYACIRCNKPFGTLKAIEAMLDRLGGHAMFQGAAAQRLKMCGDCRVIDIHTNPHEVRITDL